MLLDVLPRSGEQNGQSKINRQSGQAPLERRSGCAASQEKTQQTELDPPPTMKRLK
jgi:hypothetical protein